MLTYLHVKEDGQTLYGFADGAEKHLFVLLIGVSGVGPSTAQQLLSSLGTEEIRQAIVGENAFAHEAGIHQHGVLKNPLTYEIMTPDSVGLTSNKIVIGKHSGRFALGKKLEELGYHLNKEDLNRVYTMVTKLADEQKVVNDEDLMNLMATTKYSKEKPDKSVVAGG